MNHLINILDGFTSAFSWGPSQRPYLPTKGGFRRDQDRLRSDVKKVGDDLRKSLREHGESISKSGSEKR